MSDVETATSTDIVRQLTGKRIPFSNSWAITICIGFILLPFVTKSPFLITIGTTVMITAIAAVSLHLVVRIGHVSLGHGGFMGVGAYTAALLMDLHWSFVPSLCAGFVVPAMLGLVIGPLVLRLTGKYFVLVTFIVGEILRVAMENWTSLTGGANGIFWNPRTTAFHRTDPVLLPGPCHCSYPDRRYQPHFQQ